MSIGPEKDAFIGIRLPSAVRAAWEVAAQADGRTLSSWIIARCGGLPTTAPALPAPSTPEHSAKLHKGRKA
jgi:hypothetical protein